MKKPSLRVSMIACPLTIVCGVLVSVSFVRAPSTAWAQTTSGACSDQILRGDYGFTIDGFAHPAAGVSLPVRGVTMTNFDGDGKLSQVDHVVFDGIAPALEWTKGTGTYHVNADCTGTFHIDEPAPFNIVNARFVVVGHGKEIHAVVTAPFGAGPNTTTAVGIRRD
jgi:hypothetical protein